MMTDTKSISSTWIAGQLEQALVWFTRIILFLLLVLALVSGNSQDGLILAAALLVHGAVYVAVARLDRGAPAQNEPPASGQILPAWKPAVLSLADIALGSAAFYATGNVEGRATVLGFCVAGIVATRFGLWLSLAVNAAVWLIFSFPFLYNWLWLGESFGQLPAIGNLVVYLALTLILNYLASVESRQSRINEETSNRLYRLASVYEAGRAIAASLEMETVLKLATTKAVEILDGKGGSLWLMDPDSGNLLVRATAGLGAEPLAAKSLAPGEGIAGAVVETGEGLAINDVQTNPRWSAAPDVVADAGVQALICVPLERRGRVSGAIQVIDKQDGSPFGQEDMELLSALAGQAAIAIENASLYEKTDESLNKRLRELATLEEIDHELGTSLDFHHVLRLVLQRAMELCSASSGMIGTLSSDGQWLQVHHRYGERPDSATGPGPSEWPVGDGIIGRALRQGQPALVADVLADPDYKVVLPSTRSELAVPIKREERVIGVLNLESERQEAFSEDDVHFLEHLADHAAIAIENARLFSEEQRRATALATLNQVSAAVSSVLDPDEVLKIIVDSAIQVAGCQKAAIFVVEHGYVNLKMSRGLSDEYVAGAQNIEISTESRAQAVLRDEPLVVRDIETDPRLAEFVPLARQEGFRALADVPLHGREENLGEFTAYYAEPHDFTAIELDTLKTFANQAAIAIENAHLFEAQQRRVRELSILFEASAAVSSSLALDEVLSAVAGQVARALNVSTCSISHWDPVRDTVTTLAHQDIIPGLPPGDVGVTYSLADYPATARVLHERRPAVVQVSDLEADPAEVELLEQLQQKSLLMIPLVARDSVVGLLELYESHHGREFSADDIRLGQALANQAAVAIENARLYEQTDERLRARLDQLTALQRTMQALNATLALDGILQVVLEAAIETCAATHGNVLLTDMDTGELTLWTSQGYSEAERAAISQSLQEPDRDTVTQRAIYSGQPQLVADAWRESYMVCVRKDTRSALAVPIFYERTVVGVINLRHTDAGAFDQEDVAFIESLAEQAAIAIGNALRFEDQVKANTTLRERTEQMGRLLEISQKLRAGGQLEDTLEEIAYAIQETVGFNVVLISLSEGVPPMLRRVAAAGLPLSVLEEMKTVRQPLERYERILREEYRQGSCYFFPFQKLDDWQAELDVYTPMAGAEDWHEGQWHPQDMLLVPLRGAGGKLLGHISVDEPRDGRRPTRQTMEALTIFANQAAIAVENTNLYEDVHRRADKLALINQVSQTLTQVLEPQQVLETVVKAIGLLFQCETAAVFQPEPADGKFVAAASFGLPLAKLRDQRFAAEEGLVGHVAATRLRLLVPDTEREPLYVEGPLPTGSMLCAPMVAGSQAIGVLTAGSSRKHAFADSDLVLLSTLADQAAAALENARLFAGTQQAAVQLSLLNVIGRQAAAQLELGEMLRMTANALHQNLGYHRVALLLVDEASQELSFAAANEDFWPAIPPGYRQCIGEGLVGAAAASGKSVLANDAQADPRFVRLGDLATAASLSVPIQIADKVSGVLHVEADRRGAFGEQDVAALEIAADQVAVAIENARLFQETERRVAELATINEIGRAISGALDAEQLSELIYTQVSKLLDTRNFHIALCDPAGGSIRVEFLVEEGQRQPAVRLEMGQGLTSHLISTGQPILLGHGTEEFLRAHNLALEQDRARSWLGVPMMAEDRVIGAIAVQSFDKENAFDRGHLNLLATVAGQAAVAFQNASLFQERERRIAELSVLNEMAQAISSSLELDDLLETIHQQVSRIFDTTNFYIATYVAGSEEWTLALAIEHGAREPLASYSIHAGLTGHLIRSRQPVLLKSLREYGAFHEQHGIRFVGEQARSWLGVPLVAADQVVGVMAIQSYEHEHLYDEQDLALFSTIAAGTAAAVRNAQLYQQIVNFSSDLEERVEARTHDLEEALHELTQERDRVETLYRITSELGTTLELERVLQRALDLFADSLGITHGTITLLDQETRYLNLRASLEPIDHTVYGAPEETAQGWGTVQVGYRTPLRPGVGLAGWTIEHREPALVPDITQDPRWIEIPGRDLDIRSVVAAPLSLGGGDILGVLTLGHPQVGYFNREHLKLVTAAAAQIAMAVNNSDLYAFITDQADQLGTMLQSQQAEAAKNQAVLESIADGVLVLDHNGRVLLVNPAAEEMLGIAAKAVEGDHFRYILGMGETAAQRDLAQGLYTELRRRIESPEGSELLTQASTVRLEAGKRALAVNIAPLITTIGGIPGVVAALRDISREVEIERLKNEFISTVSHELRTPMTSIKGYTDLLFLGMAGGLSDAQRSFLQIIKSNADRLTALVNDILDISRIETGRIRLTIESLKLETIVSDVVLAFREQYRDKGLALNWEAPEGLPEVRGDKDRVTQVLNNLIANAWHYTPSGSVTVSIKSLDGFLQVDVTDTGIGISEENISRIWDRFYRADHPVVEEAGGTGLGLSIVKMFVDMLGGQIWVESEEGVGSTFSFTLPFATASVPEVVADLIAPEPTAVVSRRPKILVVEDDHDLALLLRRQLEMEGYQVVLAGSGEDALWLAREEQPQLITLDIMLPDVDGFSVLERLKDHPVTAPIPVVIVSVLTDAEEGYALGAVDYVVKPFVEDKLLEAIQQALIPQEMAQPYHLLVVDDDADIRGFLKEALSYHGYRISTAANGINALEQVAEQEIDLVLLDLKMPGMDGYEVIRRLKANEATRAVPIIVITASPLDKERDRVRVLDLGASQYVTKPLSVEMLVQEIKNAIAERQME
jgi:PAS domain S-box-containing protein